jgi:hypothetical protein
MAQIHWDEAGLMRALTSREVMAAAERVAERVAEKARAQNILVEHEPGDVGLPVEVSMQEKEGEPYASVTIAHPAGLAVQAKHGILTRSAAELGFEVTLWYTTRSGVRRLASQAQVDNWTRGT